MLDAVYGAMYAAIRMLFESQRVRRSAILGCAAVPLGLMLWNPPWFLQAYLFTAPLLLLSTALAMVDFHLWDERRCAEKARRAKDGG
jgi:hypothetical protein